ncbi:DNA polymerase III subunit alpha [Psittacicella melopsittaci]|uniref:DNA polymerase III subunit alpha n=1 Tax=Psittacicella melopsittaci TaxID=2028576 RepID=A0A3A1Y082_9GAMM|nr:DNA polymerase III subunit alpha [Psittacicella melopsittaci]RIY31722.1 DNA polymerase III subunit alpha [Psittacicella melopsittaci]
MTSTKNIANSFIHLRVHSDFSINSGVMKVKDIISLAGQYHMPAVAISDLNMFCGLIKLYEQATAQGIKPIPAIDTQFMDERGRLHDVTLLAEDEEGYVNLRRIMTQTYVRARGKIEYTGRVRSLKSTKRDPRIYITYEQMEQHSQGVICLLPAYFGPLGNSAREDKIDFADPCYERLKAIYQDKIFQAIARCQRPGEKGLEKYVLEYSIRYQMPLVATNDVLFKRQTDFKTHQIRECISQGVVMAEYQPEYTSEQYFKTGQEMAELFADLPVAISNTSKIAQMCTVKFKLGHHDLPRFTLDPSDPAQKELKDEFDLYVKEHPEVDEEEWILEKLAWQGLEARLKVLYPDPEEREAQRPRYNERLEYELGIIKRMKFPGYFLIVQEFINWSKKNEIPVGPGRGSGAGSLVAYTLRITDLDPLKYALLFERFLNPSRKSMPDFDVDFCNEGRARVIEHMQEHYGKDSVSQIMTFGTMGAKMVVRDVARVMGIDRHKADNLAKALQDKLEYKVVDENGAEETKTAKGTLENNVKYNPVFKAYYENTEEPEYRHIVDYSKPLEGLVRQVGKHAAGIVISPIEMNNYSAFYISEDGEQSTHFDKDDIEHAGLVKFDFLGLKNLTIIKNAIKMIHKRQLREGVKPEDLLDINLIPLDDPACYELLQKGDTHGIFQLESEGITKMVVNAQPKTFEDIIALIALYRPGPLQSGMVENYINRKNGLEEVYYPTPELNFEVLKDILDPTYGVIVYQEQVMQIAQTFSGYTLGDADNLRRAMGKKKQEEMDKERGKFIEGATKNNHDPAQAQALFDLVDKFAGYGFNKSHSAAYALISYQTAYLKAHYRAEFLAAVLTNGQSDISKIYGTVKDLKNTARKIRVDFIRPSVNYSFEHFDVDHKGRVIYSLAALKGVGVDVVKELIKEREANGNFKDFYDFLSRCGRHFSESQLKVMINAGCFDDFIAQGKEKGHSREVYHHVLKPILAAVKNSAQGNLFADLTENIDTYIYPDIVKEVKPWPMDERVKREYDAFNFYFAGHPINAFSAERQTLASASSIDDLFNKFSDYNAEVLSNSRKGGNQRAAVKSHTLVVHIDSVRKSKSFDGSKNVLDLAFSDETGNYRGDMFSNLSANQLAELADQLEQDSKAVVTMQFSSYQNKDTKETRTSMRIRNVVPLQTYISRCKGKIYALFDIRKAEGLAQVNNYFKAFIAGKPISQKCPLEFHFLFYTRFGVGTVEHKHLTSFTPGIYQALKEICGPHNIILELEYVEPEREGRTYRPQAR